MYKTAVEWWQLTQSQEEGHYGQTQFGHHCNSLSGSYIFPTNTTNTKRNFQNIFEDWRLIISFSRLYKHMIFHSGWWPIPSILNYHLDQYFWPRFTLTIQMLLLPNQKGNVWKFSIVFHATTWDAFEALKNKLWIIRLIG